LIPFNRPFLIGPESAYVLEAFRGEHISGDGAFTRQCHAFLERELGVAKALLTTSCTHALEMAAILLDFGPDDEVILPAFTFVSCANAFVLRGATPVFADVLPDTLNIDPADVARLITPRTKAILVVHYAGVACDMRRLEAIARERNVTLIEDNAHGLFGSYEGRPLGSIGALATLSFHETKNFTCGEGGALLINDLKLIERAEIIREKGTNRSQFFRGQVDKYSWVDIGSSFLPSDILAAFLFAQLEQWKQIQAARRTIWERYDRSLTDWARENGIKRPTIPAGCEQAYHLYYLLFPTLGERTRFISFMRAAEMHSVFHYLPLNRSDMARTLAVDRSCPVTEDISDRLARLPFYTSLEAADQDSVIERLLQFRCEEQPASEII
jgi:dTDP-4-amino-4,6-dideoxygalactose transaminase